MVTCTIKSTEARLNSANISLQQDHIELYVQDRLFSIEHRDHNDNILKVYQGPELSRLIASAIARGRRYANTAHGTDIYYLGER